jgi:hypothetical protein
LSVARSLAVAAGLIFLVMGMVHGAQSLRDVLRPTSFTPSDPRVREAMQRAELAYDRRVNVWLAWLGFNLSHSLGLFVFGAVLLALAWSRFELFANSGAVQLGAVLVAAAYVLIGSRFFFWLPAAGSASGLLCLLGSALLCWAGAAG